MANPVTVPRLGWSMEEGTFVEWLKADGDDVRVGDPLFVLEGEKAAESIEAIDGGVLRLTASSPAPGTVVKVGQTLAFVAVVGEMIAEESDPSLRFALASPANNETFVAKPLVATARDERETQARVRPRAVTSRARRVARERGIDLAAINGTGRNGRIRERDLGAGPTSLGRLVPHSPTRRTIAARMVAGVTQAAPVTLTAKVEATGLVTQRRELPGASFNDVLVVLAAATLRRHPMLLAQWRDDGLWIPDALHIGIAVDTEAGLLAPVIRDADRLSVDQVAICSRDLIERARTSKLGGDDLRGATFTITNLGAFGIDAFTPIITLPQCAVLGVGRVRREPVCDGGAIVARDMVTLSLTFDHRVVDGAPAARFLQDLGRAINRGEP